MPSAQIKKLVDDLNKKHGGGRVPAVVLGSDVPPVEPVPCASPALGFVLGIGGWPKARLVEILGKEHAGKTSLVLLALKDCFDHEGGKRSVAFVDIEHRFDPEWARYLGLEVGDDLVLVQPENAEAATDIALDLIRTGDVCALAWDSVGASMSSDAHMSYEEKQRVMAWTAVVMTRNVNKMAPVAHKYDCTVLYLNQLRADMSGGNRPSPWYTPGGHAMRHMTSVRLYLRSSAERYFERREGFKDPVQVGFRMYFKTLKNSWAPPYREGSSDFYFEPCEACPHVGFDTDADVAALALAFGIVEQRGGHYYWGDLRAQGRDNFLAKARSEGRFEALGEAVRALVSAAPVSKIDAPLGPQEVTPDGPDISDPNV